MQFESILLIDDNSSTNYLNEFIIQQEEIAKHVHIVDSSEEAIAYLKRNPPFNSYTSYPLPSLILLDINMPIHDGWDFLAQFEKLRFKGKENVMICMLSTSESASDKAKSGTFKIVHGYGVKPLQPKWLHQICKDYHSLNPQTV